MSTKLHFSIRAHKDILAIARYTEESWGRKQRDRYISTLFIMFDKLRQSPKIGVKRSEFSGDVRAISVESHVIYYVFNKQTVSIITVLHKRMDPALHLS